MTNIEITHRDRLVRINVYSESESISNYLKKYCCFYEKDFLAYIQDHYPVQRNIIDIGANIGNHSLFFAEFLKYDTIYCFEPYKENVDILRENMKSKKSFIYDVALSDKNGDMPLYNSEHTNNGGFSLECYPNSSYLVNDSIPVRTLDSFGLSDISMIKIDVESHELAVLEGACKTIIESKPIIFVEDLSYNYPQFALNRYDLFFKEVGYRKQEANLLGSMMDLWIPKQ